MKKKQKEINPKVFARTLIEGADQYVNWYMSQMEKAPEGFPPKMTLSEWVQDFSDWMAHEAEGK